VAEARWLEVSIKVSNEIAEAVAEVMSRYISNGVVVESNVTYTDADQVNYVLDEARVYGYLVMDEHVEENRQRLTESLWHLGAIQPIPAPEFRAIEDEDWMAAWKKHYKPISIGKRLLVLPAWYEQEDKERVAVKIDPSMAFGTGTHPSTQLCLAMVEDYAIPGQPAIDIGCGSGILSIAALKLGASHALGVDIDNASVLATKENAETNAVLADMETGLGSVTEVKDALFSIKQAPLVLANILAPIIIQLFDDGLADLVLPGGTLVLAGILAGQADGVLEAAQAKGLQLKEKRQIEDWVAMALLAPLA
jgi:ribosomal protein L11 methyltransferase